ALEALALGSRRGLVVWIGLFLHRSDWRGQVLEVGFHFLTGADQDAPLNGLWSPVLHHLDAHHVVVGLTRLQFRGAELTDCRRRLHWLVVDEELGVGGQFDDESRLGGSKGLVALWRSDAFLGWRHRGGRRTHHLVALGATEATMAAVAAVTAVTGVTVAE